MNRRILVVLTLGLTAGAAAAGAQPTPSGPGPWYGPEQSIRLRVGGFQPQGDSQYWDEKERDFTGDAKDLKDAFGEIAYQIDLAPLFGLRFTGTTFEGQNDQAYRDFTDEDDNDITHTTTLEIASATVGGVFYLAPRQSAFRPYLGAGAGLYAWRLEEDGSFIDFTPPPAVIFDATLEAEGTAFGYYALAGFEVPLGRSASFFAEGRWTQAEDDLEDDFVDFGKLDLSGTDVGAGIAWRF
jgi:hypothetical protein